MIVEAVKFVIETPEKITKGILNCTRYLFALVLSLILYSWLAGPWENGQITEWEVWRQWFVTGKVLLWIFLFVGTYFLLFSLMPAFTILPLLWVERNWTPKIKPNQDLSSAILKLLTLFKLVNYEPKNQKLTSTRHTRQVVEFIRGFDQEEQKEDVAEEHSSYLDFWHLFVLFLVYYFASGLGKHWLFTGILTLLLVIMPIIYCVIRWLYDFFVDHSKQILFVLEGIELNATLEAALKGQGYPIIEELKQNGVGYRRFFFYAGKKHYLYYYRVDGKITLTMLRQFVTLNQVADARVILFTNADIDDTVREEFALYGQWLQVALYRSVDELPYLMDTCFPLSSPKHILF